MYEREICIGVTAKGKESHSRSIHTVAHLMHMAFVSEMNHEILLLELSTLQATMSVSCSESKPPKAFFLHTSGFSIIQDIEGLSCT